MVPYVPGKPISEIQREYKLERVIKLASNENPLGPSPLAIQAIKDHLHDLHRYPDPTHFELIKFLSDLWQIPVDNIALGNGSDEILDILIRICCEPGQGILQSRGAFSAYGVSAQSARAKLYEVNLLPNYQFDLDGIRDFFLKNAGSHQIRLIFLPNPNNPTGSLLPQKALESFLQDFDKLANKDDIYIVLDEAYTEFVRDPEYVSALKYFHNFKNVLVLRTFSKAYGLAGLRIGALVGPADLVNIYNRVRKPFNVNTLAQVAVKAALRDEDFIKASQLLVWNGLEYFYREFAEMGLPVIRSQGNFVMFDTKREAAKVYQALLRKGVILRPVANYGFPSHLRINVGLEEENKLALSALKEVLQQIPKTKKDMNGNGSNY